MSPSLSTESTRPCAICVCSSSGAPLDEVLDSPILDETRLAWPWRLLEPQLRARRERRVERRISYAYLRDILLAGWSGTGKSHITKTLALCACHANRRVRYTTSEAMLSTLVAALADDTLPLALRPYVRSELLVIDEVGLEQVERHEATHAGLMQKVLLPRYKQSRSTIITSNLPWESWGEYLGNHLGAMAILDLLIHKSHIIVIEGPSWRDHEHRKEADSTDLVITPPSPAAESRPTS